MRSRPPDGARPGPTWFVVVCLGLVGAPSSATYSASAQSPTPQVGGERAQLIAAEFKSLCQQSRRGGNPFYSDRSLEQWQRTLEQLETASDPPLQVTIETHGRLAYEYLRLGRTADALEQTAAALDLLDRHQLRIPGIWGYLKEVEGTAHFQAAEDQNCLELHNHASCVLPLTRDAVHTQPAGAKAARTAFLELLQRSPNRVSARWLANLSTLLAGETVQSLPAALRVPEGAFESPATDLGPWFNLGPRLLPSAPDLAGGAIADDFDGDGRVDLISSSMDPCAPLVALRNTGSGFEDVTASWGLDGQLGGLNLIHADFDDDGWLDLLVLRGAWFGGEGRIRNSLLHNRIPAGTGFHDVTLDAGLAYPAFPTQSAAAADYDGDGDLDLAIANEGADIVIDPSQASNEVTDGHPFQLFRNLARERRSQNAKDGRPAIEFVDVTRISQISDHSFTKGVAWGDIDNDGDPDLHLSNFGPNRVFRNDTPRSAGGSAPRFTEIKVGVDAQDRRTFANWFFDVDQDGDLDLFVASYNVPADVVAGNLLGLRLSAEEWADRPDRLRSNPILFRNEGSDDAGSPRFVDVSAEYGLDAPTLAMGANTGDIDNDGYPDIYLGTGMPDFSAIQPNIVLRNRDGQAFEDLTYALGLGHLQKGHGVAFADIDHDGDLDLFHQLGGAFPYDVFPNALFINPLISDAAGDEASWLVLETRGVRDNRFGVGARITVTARRGERTIERTATVGSGGSFGGSSLRTHVGLADANAVESIQVQWPSGASDRYEVREINRYYRLLQGEIAARPLEPPPVRWLPAPSH